MSPQTTVIGLFRTSGSADNARNRLKTEGFGEDRIMLKVLKEAASARAAIPEELETEALSPLFAIFGDLVSYIKNGETALLVRGLARNDAEDVARILQFFDPLRVDLVSERDGVARHKPG